MLMAREDAKPASWLGGAAKRLLVLVFPSCEVANIDSNHMPLEHHIGQFNAGEIVLFHHDIVPICATARENDPRRGITTQELSICVPERNTVRVLHCNSSLHGESA